MGATLAPDRLTQAMEAKQHANLIRALRKQLRIDLKACRTRHEACAMAARFVGDPPYWLLRMTVGDLLLSCRGLHKTTVIAICNKVPVSPLRDIGDMTPARRRALVGRLQDIAARRA